MLLSIIILSGQGCELLNRMILNGQRNRWYSIQQRATTAELEKMTKACYDSLEVITKDITHYLEVNGIM